MDPIPVPAPPRSAYNQNRRVSDLLYNQLKHFQHVELKRGDLGIEPQIARNIHTEGGAAQYIAAVTTALRGKAPAIAAAAGSVAVMPAPKPAPKPQKNVALSIAAVAESPAAVLKAGAKKGAAKKAKKAAKPNRGKK